MGTVCHPNALLIAGEIAGILASMRSNSRWSSSASRFSEEEVEDDLSESLKSLRREVFSWEDWTEVEPLDYLTPFLEVIKSPETTATVTDVALTSLHTLITSNILGDSSAGIYESIQGIAQSVTQCKFEATYPAFDECVLNRILDVLAATVSSPQGLLLSHDNLINIFQACYRIGHYQTEKGRETSEILTQSSRKAMQQLIHTIFSRVDSIAPTEPERFTPLSSSGHVAEKRLHVSPPLSPRQDDNNDDALDVVQSVMDPTAATTTATTTTPADALPVSSPLLSSAGATATPPPAATSTEKDTTTTTTPVVHSEIVSILSPIKTTSTTGDHHSNDINSHNSHHHHHHQPSSSSPSQQPSTTTTTTTMVVPAAVAEHSDGTAATGIVDPSPLSPAGLGLSIDPGNGEDPSALDNRGYGIEALSEVLDFIVSFVAAPRTRQHGDLPAHGLSLVITTLTAAGSSLEHHEALMTLLQKDLIKAMFTASKTGSLACLSGICRVSLALYVHLGRHFLLQIEALLGLLLLPLAEGKGALSPEHQHIALEGIVDFCCQPEFVPDIYLNLDCRIERSNLLEQICTLLSRAAFPVHDSITPLHVLSLDGILSILSSLAAGSMSNGLPYSPSIDSLDGRRGNNDDDASVSKSKSTGDRQVSESDTTTPEKGKGVEDKEEGDGDGKKGMYIDIWTPLSLGQSPPVLEAIYGITDTTNTTPPITPTPITTTTTTGNTSAEYARAEKILKARLSSAADHFNRDLKKGFQYAQSVNLLPSPLDPGSVARFLRYCPGLAKPSIGEVLGERDSFYDAVREHFIETFDFTGMRFDLALRLFMDAFRPPGEGQKIDRIMQVFGKRYYELMPHIGLKNADAAYILAYSVIMLNTDLHNTQNKKKMSLEDFARINRSTNDGNPMPPDLLSGIYAAISTDELKISSECSPEELPHQTVFWIQMMTESRKPRGQMVVGARADFALEKEVFTLVWGPTLAATSVIVDGSSDPRVVRRAMEGLFIAAQLGDRHAVEGIINQLLDTLAKFTSSFNYSSPKAVLMYGASVKIRSAFEATFNIAHQFGDSLKSGWRHVLNCIVRLYKAGLLPASIIMADGEDIEEADARMPHPLLTKSKGSSGSLFSRAITSLMSTDGADATSTEFTESQQEELMRIAVQSAEACRVDEIVGDSKFLTGDALIELIKATMWSGGDIVTAAKTGNGIDTAELSLEILIALTLRNRDRVSIIWPLVHEYLAACTAPDSAEENNSLVERAVRGLLRVCQRLLPYKEDTAEMLLSSLGIIVTLAPAVGWALAEGIAVDILALLKQAGLISGGKPTGEPSRRYFA